MLKLEIFVYQSINNRKPYLGKDMYKHKTIKGYLEYTFMKVKKKLVRDMYRHFTEEETHKWVIILFKDVSLISRDMQYNEIVYHFILIKLAKESNNT